MRCSKSILFLFISLILLSNSFSKFQEFSEYNTKIIFNNDSTITIENEIHLRNTHSVGIVPGEFEFELYQYDEEFNIIDFDVVDELGNTITTRLIENDNKTSLIMNLFTPILPGFEYTFTVSYTFEFRSSGLLFNRLEVPIIQETQLPTKSGKLEIIIPKNKRFTYVSQQSNQTDISINKLSFPIDSITSEKLLIEYSSIPIRLGNYPGSLVFWLIINTLLIILLGFQLKKEITKLNE